MHLIPEALNILDESNMPQIAALRKSCQEEISSNPANTYATCCNIMTYIEEVSGNVFAYD